jgi:predicted nucleic acid-binding protein
MWFLRSVEQIITSELTCTEVVRTVRRFVPEVLPTARLTLASVDRLTLSGNVFERAGMLDPLTLRSLEALHLACALTLGEDLNGIVTYDRRLAEAAELLGIRTLAPK